MTTDGAYTTVWTIVQRARTGHVGDFLTDEVCHLARKSSSQLFFRPAGTCRFPQLFPTACAVGCILAPLRGEFLIAGQVPLGWRSVGVIEAEASAVSLGQTLNCYGLAETPSLPWNEFDLFSIGDVRVENGPLCSLWQKWHPLT
jgi:hypothetical protein